MIYQDVVKWMADEIADTTGGQSAIDDIEKSVNLYIESLLVDLHKAAYAAVMTSTMTIYQALKRAGCYIDNHESDLYVKVSPSSTEILKIFGKPLKKFRSAVDGTLWYDIPFAFDPFWENKPR